MKKLFYGVCALFIGIQCIFNTSIFADTTKEVEEIRVVIMKDGIRKEISFEEFKIEDTLVYYLEPFKNINSNDELMLMDAYSSKVKETLLEIAASGCNEERNSKEWYMTTQFYLWETLGYEIEVINFEEYEEYRTQLQNRIAQRKLLPSFNEMKVTLKKGVSCVLEDTNYVLPLFEESEKVGRAIVEMKENTMTLQTTSNIYGEGVISFMKKKEFQGLPIVFGDIEQKRVLVYPEKWESVGNITYRVQPYGKLHIRNKGEVITNAITSDMYGYEVQSLYSEIGNICNVKTNIYAKEDIYDVWGNKVYEKDELVESLISTQEGVLSMDLIAGAYYIQQEQIDGYKKNEKVIDVVIGKEEEDINTQEIVFTLEKEKNEISFYKEMEKESLLDLENAYLDVYYGVYNEEDIVLTSQVIPKGTLLYVLRMKEDGSFNDLLDLPVGKYYTKELASNEHYVVDETMYPFEIQNEKRVQQIKFKNEILKRNVLEITNTNEEKNAISSTFVLYDANKNEVEIGMTDKDGKYIVEGLVDGVYYLQERETSKGYKVNHEEKEIQVFENTKVHVMNEKQEYFYEAVNTGGNDKLVKEQVTLLFSMCIMYGSLIIKIYRRH